MKQKVYDYLAQRQIPYELTEHPEVHTVADIRIIGLDKMGVVCKNLFTRDARGKRHFLIVARSESKVDLKSLGTELNLGRLSFASEERLMRYLGVAPGSVSLFGLLNDTDHAVELVLERRLLSEPRIGFHPNFCDATVWISGESLQKILDDLQYAPFLADFADLEENA